MARENRKHNQRIYRQYQERLAMEAENRQNNRELDQNDNVHLICQDAFLKAYAYEFESGKLYVQLDEAKNFEDVTVQDIRERGEITLRRSMAHAALTNENETFAVARRKIISSHRNDYQYLVVLNSDREQFYIKDNLTDDFEPYGIDESRELLAEIAGGYMMPLKNRSS